MNSKEKIPHDPREDLRERKRRLTLDLITQTALRLFKENGYEETTLDAIAAASGISRRTFFYYLKSKEDVLLAHESGNFPHALRPTFLEQSPEQAPLEAARKTFLALASLYDTEESLIADQILRSIEALRLRKDALFVHLEGVMAMGTLRFAKENWREGSGARPLTSYIDEAFELLYAQLKQ
jgi:AcrR family transcriptional regulator